MLPAGRMGAARRHPVAVAPRPDLRRLPNEAGAYLDGDDRRSAPYGKFLALAVGDREEVLLCPVDLAFIDLVRDGYCFPFRDRRVDSYGDLAKLYGD